MVKNEITMRIDLVKELIYDARVSIWAECGVDYSTVETMSAEERDKVDFSQHEIDQDLYESILDEKINGKGLRAYEEQAVRTNVRIGLCPKLVKSSQI